MSSSAGPRRVLAIAVSWMLLWMSLWLLVGGAIRVLDPDSLDPGEGWMAIGVLGPMGLLTGAVLAGLLSLARVPRLGTGCRSLEGPPPLRVIGLGTVATGLVQLLYLGHGDQGLAANAAMALLFSGVGALVTALWLMGVRWWLRRSAAGR